ncbi:MAG: hypothetical protein JNM94_14210 [Phycisphaerae bacterium]|nr:hypothetical protein [Phycisphaerae bacterium]
METTCPRCGYDLSGASGSHDDASPPDGICTECGLTFSWSDLRQGRLHRSRVLSEYARWRWLPVALVMTHLLAHWPWSLWRRVRIELPIRASRLLLQLAVAGAIAYLIAGLWAVSLHTRAVGDFVRTLRHPAGVVEVWTRPVLGRLQTMELQPWGTPMAPGVAIVAPRDWNVDTVWKGTCVRSQPRFLVVAACTTVASGLAFVLLPASLRRANVRVAQLVRVWCYLTITLPTFCLAVLVVQRFGILRPLVLGSSMRIGFVEWWPALVFLCGWLFVGWRVALKHYLRVAHPTAVAAAMTAIAFLGVFAVAAVLLL